MLYDDDNINDNNNNDDDESLNGAGWCRDQIGRRDAALGRRRRRSGRRRRRGGGSGVVGLVLAFDALLEVHLGVALLLVGAGELAAACVARERLLARVRPYVRRQVIRARESTHADPTLKRLLSCYFITNR